MLRAFAAPDFLNLVAAKWKYQLVIVLCDIPCERHRQIEVKRVVSSVASRLRVKSCKAVNLSLRLLAALRSQDGVALDGRCLDWRESIALKRRANLVNHLLFEQALGGRPLRESADGRWRYSSDSVGTHSRGSLLEDAPSSIAN